MLHACALPLLLLLTIAAAGSRQVGGGACSTSLDCWLNGDCLSSACSCDAAWWGPHCGTLAELPSHQLWPPPDPLPGPAPALLPSSWGGTIVKGDDGLYHGYFETMCRTFTWMHIEGTVTVHATAASLEGPYTFSDIALPQQSMTPHIVRDTDGAYLLLHQRQYNVSGLPQCTGDYGISSSAQQQQQQQQQQWQRQPPPPPQSRDVWPNGPPSIARSSSLYGPWEPMDFAIPLPQDYILPNPNPSLLPLAGGGYRLAFTTMPRNFSNWGSERVVFAEAQDWRSGVFQPTFGNGAPSAFSGGEDPFLWRDDRGFHAVFHRMGVPENPLDFNGTGGLAVSLTGSEWVFAPSPIYTVDVPWAASGGGALHFTRRERPEFLLGVDGRVQYLLTGCEAVVGVAGHPSLTVLTPLGALPPAPPRRHFSVTVHDKSPQPVLSKGLPLGAGHSPCNLTFNPAWLQPSPGLSASAVIVRVSGCPEEYGGAADHLMYAFCSAQGVCGDLQPEVFPFEHLAEDPRVYYNELDSMYYLYYYANGTNQSTVFLRRSPTPLNMSSWELLASALPWHRNGCAFPALDGTGDFLVLYGETYYPAFPGKYLPGIGLARTSDWRSYSTVSASLLLPVPSGPDPEVCLEAATPPVRLSTGDWLHLYAAGTVGWGPWGPGANPGSSYSAGWVVLSGSSPGAVLQRSVLHPFAPTMDYEVGSSQQWPVCRNNTLFVTSLVPVPGEVDVFRAWYGAADANVATALVSVGVVEY